MCVWIEKGTKMLRKFDLSLLSVTHFLQAIVNVGKVHVFKYLYYLFTL